jgi:SAM-dependent methyltransferase
VLEAAFELACLTSSDLVMDLGCGDGRIVIAAAERYGSCRVRRAETRTHLGGWRGRFGCRGIGVELDPYLLDFARKAAAARLPNAAELVDFVAADLFTIEPASFGATVLILFITTAGLEKMAHMLDAFIRAVGPAARIVTIGYAVPSWCPDDIRQVCGGARTCRWCRGAHDDDVQVPLDRRSEPMPVHVYRGRTTADADPRT